VRCCCLPTHVATFSRHGAQYDFRPAAHTPRRYLANLHSSEPEVLPSSGFLFRRYRLIQRLSIFQPRHFPALQSQLLPIFSNFHAHIAHARWPLWNTCIFLHLISTIFFPHAKFFFPNIVFRTICTIIQLIYYYHLCFSSTKIYVTSERSFHKKVYNLSHIMSHWMVNPINY